MKKTRLGEFQELILMTVIVLEDDAYGNEIQRELEERLDERLSVGAIQTALKRMEEKGFLTKESVSMLLLPMHIKYLSG